MTANPSLTERWRVLAFTAVALVAGSAGVTYLVLRNAPGTEESRAETTSGGLSVGAASPDAVGTSRTDIVVTLSPEAVARAGITVATIGAGTVLSGLRLPGVVEPNAYRQVVVTPLVSGRLTRVLVELGQHVRAGQSMAQLFSPELAEAITRYTAARAMLDAHERELGRTEKLVDIGAASRQELERLHAEHTGRLADVQSTRSRLELLGIPTAELDSVSGPSGRPGVEVPAPIDGVVTERNANVGLNVDPSSKLFTVVDLATVWVVAELYEKDFSLVRVGSPATVTTTAYPDLRLRGRVSYIDPQVSEQTRTAKVRVEVQNSRNQLRLGMYADVAVEEVKASSILVVPRSAVQVIGDRQVVYAADPSQPGRFTEREVHLGPANGEQIPVHSGVQAGDVLAVEGTFFLRAEAERLGLRAHTH